ncbi:perlucin-like protein isoform X1 [Polypterus senegalus]|uniref:perlucin-like protein isoform X1 n=1 Tax=Polypterus senegalus TaxID=55291 RepID=UPI00196609F9|nr:perlucin-like protein isoform X1 [Polypterus senegalus]
METEETSKSLQKPSEDICTTIVQLQDEKVAEGPTVPEVSPSPSCKYIVCRLLLLLYPMLVIIIIFLTVYQQAYPICLVGWVHFRSKCYFFSTNEMTWQSSHSECMAERGHLVIIESAEEQAFLKNEINVTGGNNKGYWIGLSDQESEDKFLWVDNRRLNPKYSFWGKGYSNNQSEDCVQIGINGNWDDWHISTCETPRKRICETPAELLHI